MPQRPATIRWTRIKPANIVGKYALFYYETCEVDAGSARRPSGGTLGASAAPQPACEPAVYSFSRLKACSVCEVHAAWKKPRSRAEQQLVCEGQGALFPVLIVSAFPAGHDIADRKFEIAQTCYRFGRDAACYIDFAPWHHGAGRPRLHGGDVSRQRHERWNNNE